MLNIRTLYCQRYEPKIRQDKVLFTACVMMATNRQVKGQLLGITRVIARNRRRENCFALESEKRYKMYSNCTVTRE